MMPVPPYTRICTPAGLLVLGETQGALCLCDWPHSTRHLANMRRLNRLHAPGIREGTGAVTALASAQLAEFFAGSRREFSVPLLPVGTPFQRDVWQAISQIPYGHTTSYSAIARAIGCPRSVRAVAAAVGANAISIFIPCHRVVGASGALTGYAGTLPAKALLLQIEHNNLLRQGVQL